MRGTGVARDPIDAARAVRARTVALALALVACTAWLPAARAAECIAPANPGGGADFTCREVGRIMHELGVVDAPIRTVHLPGEGGGRAFAAVAGERSGDEDLIVAASNATATRLAQGAYGGLAVDDVRFLGAIGADPGVIAVPADSPYRTLADLLEAVAADPASVAFAGGSPPGGFDHLKVLMLLERAGLAGAREVRYTGTGGDADAILRAVGGDADAVTGDVSGIVRALEAGEVRALATLTDERLGGAFADVPTAREQGHDAVAANWRGLYVPKDIPEAAYRRWSDGLARVAGSDAWAETAEEVGLVPFTLVGDDFQAWVTDVVEQIAVLSRDMGVVR